MDDVIIPSLPQEIGREYCICLSMMQAAENKYLHGDSTDSRRVVCVYDPVQGSWESLSLPPIPDLPVDVGIPHFSHFVSVKEKLVLIGGWHPTTCQSLATVFIYDFSSALWRRGSDMPTVRSLFACSASPEGLIYVAGGHDDEKNALRGAAVYDVEEDGWEDLGLMIEERDECHGVFVNGKWWVISGYTTGAQGEFQRSAQVFDPKTGVWSMVENMWTLGGCARLGTCVSGCGNLYSFEEGEVMRYDAARNVWAAVGCVPQSLGAVTCAAVFYDGILVSGCAAFDEGYAQNRNENDDIWYMYKISRGQWIALEGPKNFHGFVQSATAVEI